MKYIISFLLIFVGCLLFSCEKKSPAAPQCVAGNGGLIQVVIYANHHDTVMYNYLAHPNTVFVKYNTHSFPGDSSAKYDTFYVSNFGMRDHIHCTNLRCGDYYFYRTAYDSVNDKCYYAGFGLSVEPQVLEIDTTLNVN